MAEFAFEFWKRVDKLRGPITITKMCDDLNIKYTRIRDNRSENRYPSKTDMIAIAKYLNTSIDYLMTGRGAARGEESDVAGYLEGNAEAKAIVKAMMENPGLTEHLAAILKMMGK